MSLPEVLLWQRLRRRAGGVKFRRQHPLGFYILDFYCPTARLAVEIDGTSHEHGTRPQRDDRRTATIEAEGVTLMRVAAADVLRDAAAAADRIVRAALPLHRPAGGPPPHASHGEDFAAGAV